MSGLQRFLPADQDLLVGLFYRVGHWMSDADDTDVGTESEKAEEAQMIRVLTKLSQSENVGQLCREISAEALRQKGSWSRWSGQADSFIADVVKGKKAILGQTTVEEFQLFGKSLVTIATAVARAYRESEDMEAQETGFLSWLTEKSNHISIALSDREAHKDLNISPAEDNALIELVEALKA